MPAKRTSQNIAACNKTPSPAAAAAAASRSQSMYEDHPRGLAVPGSRTIHQDSQRQRQLQNSRAWVPESMPASSLQSFYTVRSLHNAGAWPIPSSPSANNRYPWSRQPSGLLVDTGLSKSPTSYVSDDYYEVVLDDGTRQKRSVSLSTLPPTPGVKSSSENYFYQQDQRNGSADERTALLPNKANKQYNTISSDSSDTEVEEEELGANISKPSFLSRIRSRCQLDHKQKMVLKCSLAYMLGSLFTFVPYLNNMIGGSSVSSHVVATVTVWFNPAKSIGGMIEASGFGLLYAVVALFISLLSLATTTYLAIERQMYLVSCAVTLGVWLAGSTFVIAFLKAALDKPSIRTASSLAFIILFSVLVRETSTNKSFMDTTRIEQTFSIVLIGTALTIAVCFLVWPMRSTRKLKQDINATLSSLRVLLKLLVKTFLLDADLPDFTANKQLEEAIKAHGTSFTALQKSLKEAKLEFFSMEMWRQADGYEKVVISLQHLAQHISGLRSSCGLEFEAIHESKLSGSKTRRNTEERATKVKAAHHRKKMEHELKREHSMEQNLFNMEMPGMERQISSISIGNHPHDLDTVPESPFEENPPADYEETIEEEGALSQFIRSIRGPMKSLAYTCKQTIIHLQAHFTGQATSITPTFELMKRNLAVALDIFEESEHRALLHFYRRKLKKESLQNLDVNQLHSHLMKQFPAEDVFLVYFFVFCMLEFAKELGRLVEHVESIFEPLEEEDKSMRTCLKEMFQLIFRRPVDESEKIPKETFVPNNNNTIDTLQTPSPKTRIRKVFIRLWSFFSWFRQHTVRYAIKATLISVALAVLAYIPATQQYFREYRMEWTLISIMAVMSPTVGGTNLVAVLRVLATILGCIVGAVVYLLFPTHPVILLACTWAFSVPCFWVILNHKYGRFGQFALLAYNLVVLYSYNHREDSYVSDVVDLAWKRCIAVSLGVIIGLAVTAYIWPYEARKELRKGLSDFLLRLSWLYKQIVSVCCDTTAGGQNNYSIILEQVFYDTRRDEPRPLSVEELEALSLHNKILAAQFQHIELALQVSLMSLRELLTHAPNEPRLKGPFPVKTYDAMLTCCQNILDKFLSMRIVILKDVWALQVRRAFMLPASKEWMDMAGNILLYFYLLASALQLKTPLPPYLPPAEQARQVLLKKLEQVLPSAVTYTKTGAAPTVNDDEEDGYMVYYAYVAMMENIIQELDKLGGYMKDLYGTLVPADQWQRCFGLLDLEHADTRSLFKNADSPQDYFGKVTTK